MRSLLNSIVGIILCLPVVSLRAAPVEFSEPATDGRTFSTRSEVNTVGRVLTLNDKGEKEPLELKATAQLQFTSRRLPPAGREAEALRAAREFAVARVDTEVAGLKTGIALPAQLKTIVATGSREGVRSYSPQVLMTREALDLLEMPGDPLALVALLPPTAVEPGATWNPPDWAAQMLAGVEAVESSKLNCTFESLDKGYAVISVSGAVKGQRLGSMATVGVVGKVQYSVQQNYITATRLRYDVKSEVGTINPGLEAQVDVSFTRTIAQSPGLLTDEFLASVPLEAAPSALELVFDAVPWGVRLLHSRGWHLFQAVYDGPHQVAILRFMSQGSLISQCNVAPVTAVQPGSRTPPAQFEKDIQQSLGPRLIKLSEQEDLPAQNGVAIYRVVAEGEVEYKNDKGAVKVPMNWIYYLCTAPDGRQVSFVFAIEPQLREQFGLEDRNMVTSISFFQPPARQAAR
jgi:hypothetical protein